jgi:hypothetical protein
MFPSSGEGKVPNLKMETETISEAIQFLIIRISGDGQIPEAL